MLSIKELIIGVSKFRLCKSELRDPVSTGWRHLPIGQKTSSAGQRGAAFATSRAQRQLGNWETWLPCVRETMIEYDKLVDWGAPPPKKKTDISNTYGTDSLYFTCQNAGTKQPDCGRLLVDKFQCFLEPTR